MNKKILKKMTVLVMALAIAFTVTSVKASANQINNSEFKAIFIWEAGHVKMVNNSTTTKYIIVRIEAYNNETGELAASNSAEGAKGYGEYVEARVTSSNKYNYLCTGALHGSSSPSSPVTWSVTRYYP